MGTIRKENGKWRVWYDLGPDPVTGKRRQRTKTLPTEGAAVRFLEDREAERESGYIYDVAAERITVAETVNRYLDARRIDLRASSWESARSRLHTHVTPHLGQQKLQRVSGGLLSTFYGRLQKAGVSAATIRKVHANLRTMFNWAIAERWITVNPCATARLPQHHPPELKTWTPTDMSQFLRSIQGHLLEPAFLLLAVTGMRRGEVVGLKWDDIDTHIHIRRNVTEVNGRLVVGEPKTVRARRQIAITESTGRFLKAVELEQKKNRLRMGESWEGEGWVICDALGRLIRPGRISKEFKRVIRQEGLPDIRLHDLRHSWGTNAIAAGVDPKTVSDNVGHASVRFTLDTYVGRVEEQHREAAKRIGDMYGMA